MFRAFLSASAPTSAGLVLTPPPPYSLSNSEGSGGCRLFPEHPAAAVGPAVRASYSKSAAAALVFGLLALSLAPQGQAQQMEDGARPYDSASDHTSSASHTLLGRSAGSVQIDLSGMAMPAARSPGLTEPNAVAHLDTLQAHLVMCHLSGEINDDKP